MRAALPSRWLAPAVLLGLGLLIVIAYAPAMAGSFLFDDVPLLLGYDCWRGVDQIPAILGLDGSNACTYRPVRYVTYAFDWSVASALGDGFDTRIYHVSNLFWHGVTVLAIFTLLRRWGSAAAAALVAALWALHPVHADAVAYISGRRDVVSTLFYVLAVLQLTSRESAGALTTKPVRLLVGALCFVIAFKGKEMAITLPAVVVWGTLVALSADVGRLARHFKRLWPAYALLLGATVGFVLWRGVLESHSHMQGRWWGGSPVSNFATVFALYGRYLHLVVWPSPLIGDYFPVTIPLAAHFADPRTLIGLGLYASLLVVTLVAWRRGWRAAAFGLGWFLIALLPVSHILPHHELFAEHYLYLPTIGLAVALMPLADRVLAARPAARLAGAFLATAVLAGMTVATHGRASEFESEEVFYAVAHERAPDNARVAHYLSAIYVETGRCDEALPLFAVAESVYPPGTRLGRDSLAAQLLCADARDDAAAVSALVERLLEVHPDDAYGLAMRARSQVDAGQLVDAAVDLERALRVTEGADRDVVWLLGRVYNGLGRHADALALLEAHAHEGAVGCEQTVVALLGLGVDRFPQAFDTVQGCLGRHPEAWPLYELRAWLFRAAGQLDAYESDVARMGALGAPAEAMERIRARPDGP